MKTTHFKSLYISQAYALDEDIAADNFLFQGSRNWDLYFSESIKDLDAEVLENVSLLEFDTKEELESYMYNHKTLDYSLEHAADLHKYYALINNGKD